MLESKAEKIPAAESIVIYNQWAEDQALIGTFESNLYGESELRLYHRPTGCLPAAITLFNLNRDDAASFNNKLNSTSHNISEDHFTRAELRYLPTSVGFDLEAK